MNIFAAFFGLGMGWAFVRNIGPMPRPVLGSAIVLVLVAMFCAWRGGRRLGASATAVAVATAVAEVRAELEATATAAAMGNVVHVSVGDGSGLHVSDGVSLARAGSRVRVPAPGEAEAIAFDAADGWDWRPLLEDPSHVIYALPDDPRVCRAALPPALEAGG
ncbi:hypothetical protein [Humibacter sp.]|uniref:hypothetical protein n=1 Tax=Humibacter sp. TaxID=1940291 RepID=UPI002BCF86F1|nr:hypothetical protein [Humibacter sp.]HVX09210.1 hypothetical protein [Humibacter sp.]